MKSLKLILWLSLTVIGWGLLTLQSCTPAQSQPVVTKQYGVEEVMSDIGWMMVQKPCMNTRLYVPMSEISRNILIRKISTTMTQVGGDEKQKQTFIYIICKESSFNPDARSPVGAIGIAQVMPATAQAVATKLELGKVSEKDLRDPEISVLLGYTYFLECVQITGGNLAKASACYNGGPSGTTLKAMEHGGRGVHETDNYVATIYELSERKRIADQKKGSH